VSFDFGITPPWWYFIITPPWWYFGITPPWWYFRITPSWWYFRITPLWWYFFVFSFHRIVYNIRIIIMVDYIGKEKFRFIAQ
jgi:hypothetical protein